MRTPNPGSVEALQAGCRCPVLDNNHGLRPNARYGGWIIYLDCPVHVAGEDSTDPGDLDEAGRAPGQPR